MARTDLRDAIAVFLLVLLGLLAVRAWVLRPGEPEPARSFEPSVAVGADDLSTGLTTLWTQAASLGQLEGASRLRFGEHATALVESALRQGRPDVCVAVSRTLTEHGEADRAAQLLRRSVGVLPPESHGEAHLLALAEAELARGRPTEAAAAMERAIDIQPTPARQFARLSAYYAAAGRGGPAAAAVSRGLLVWPDSPSLRLRRAELSLRAGRPDEALEATSVLLEASPGHGGARRLEIEALLVAGRTEDALAAAGDFAEASPQDAWSWLLLGAAERASGEPGAASLARASEAADREGGADLLTALAWASSIKGDSRIPPRAQIQATIAAKKDR